MLNMELRQLRVMHKKTIFKKSLMPQASRLKKLEGCGPWCACLDTQTTTVFSPAAMAALDSAS